MKEYLSLLAQRESKVVMGVHWSNLWILCLVLFATFVSIAFSNGSMLFLNDKMNDPFTNWVNVPRVDEHLDDLIADLKDQKVKDRFLIKDVQSDNYSALQVYGKDLHQHVLECRFFERLESDIVHAIFSTPGNVIATKENPRDILTNKSLGFIITLDKLLELGYSLDTIPAFIDLLTYCPNADTLGIKMIDKSFSTQPFPLLGVVRRLPMNMDMVASHYWYEQKNSDEHPFSMYNESYQREVYFYVEQDQISKFENTVSSIVPDSLKMAFSIMQDDIPSMVSWVEGKTYHMFLNTASIETQVIQQITEDIISKFTTNEVTRIFRYDVSNSEVYHTPRLLSISFSNLNLIRSFEQYAKEKFSVQIEMSQVNSKENFNSVRVMAAILSWAMIIFSIVCIILYIVNMLQSYFQKVKRNMGTFKAFGMSSYELISSYVMILFVIILLAIAISLLFTSLLQYGLHYGGVLKEGQYDYLSLWSESTIWIAIAIIILSTLVTVYAVMSKLLKKTPGDLIYDR